MDEVPGHPDTAEDMILYRYFFKEIFLAMFSVTSIVLVISVGWRTGAYLEDAAAGWIASDVLMYLVLLRLPGFLELILPVGFFLGVLLAYGRFYADSEMIVLQACGFSQQRLVLMTLTKAALVMVFTAVLTFWFKPWSENKVDKLYEDQRSLTELDTLAPGRFQMLRSGKRVTYTEEMDKEGRIIKPFINEIESGMSSRPNDVKTLMAESGISRYDEEKDARFLVLNNGYRYRGEPGKQDYQIIEYEEYGQLIEKEVADKRLQKRSAISTADLIRDDSLRSVAELHWRIAVVLLVPVLGAMAVPLSKVNPRQGRFTRLVPGLLLCFFYIMVLSVARDSLERGSIPAVLGLWWVHGIFILITAGLYQIDPLIDVFRRIFSSRREA